MKYVQILKLIIITIIISVCSAEDSDSQMILGDVIQVNKNTVEIKVLDADKVKLGDMVNIYHTTSHGNEMKIGEGKVSRIDNKMIYATTIDMYIPATVGLIAKITFFEKNIGQNNGNDILKVDNRDIYKVQVDTKRNHINPWSVPNRADKDISVNSQHYVDKAKKMADDLYKNSKIYSKEKRKLLWNEVIQNIQKAISMDNAEAYYALAPIYEDGYGDIKRDLGKMVYNIRISADRGYAEAQYTLGEMSLSGDEVANNREQAILWLQKAANQGHKEAKRELDDLLKKEEKIPVQIRGKEPKNFGIPEMDDLFDLNK